MQDVPKIVRARLQRPAPATEPHPDADLLTAFADRTLSARERDEVLKHLARCGDCREVVALALPASEAVAISSSPARAGWLSLPILRWGVVAAGVLAVMTFGVLQYRQRQEKTLVATRLMSRDLSTDSVAQSSVPTPQAAAPRAVVPRTERGSQTEMGKEAPAPSRTQRAFSADKSVPAPNAVFPSAQPTRPAASARAYRGTIGGPIAGLGFRSGTAGGSKAAQGTAPRGSAAFEYNSKNTTSAVIAQQNPNTGAAERVPAPSATTNVE